MTCNHCNDTGDQTGQGYLDCAFCDVASIMAKNRATPRRRAMDHISDAEIDEIRQVEVNAQRYLAIKAANRQRVESIFEHLPEDQRKALIDAWGKSFDATVDEEAADLLRCKGVLA